MVGYSAGVKVGPQRRVMADHVYPCPVAGCVGTLYWENGVDSDGGDGVGWDLAGVWCDWCGNSPGTPDEVMAYWARPAGRREAALLATRLMRFVDRGVLSDEEAKRFCDQAYAALDRFASFFSPDGDAAVWVHGVRCARRAGLRVEPAGDRRWLVRPSFVGRWLRGNAGLRAVIDVSDRADGRVQFFASGADVERGHEAWSQFASCRVRGLWEVVEYWLALDRFGREWRDDLAEARAADGE